MRMNGCHGDSISIRPSILVSGLKGFGALEMNVHFFSMMFILISSTEKSACRL
jgi:hypothetical protein